jgi:DNA-binding response OmpR family regulator
MKILLAEADEPTQNHLKTELNQKNFLVDVAADGKTAWGLLQSFVYDLLLLVTDLPQLDGFSLCRRLRTLGNPMLVLLLVNSANPDACIQGLESGADACLAKPIQEAHLLAQIHALARWGLRRASPVLSWGPLRLDPTSQQVTWQDQKLAVSRKEFLHSGIIPQSAAEDVYPSGNRRSPVVSR